MTKTTKGPNGRRIVSGSGDLGNLLTGQNRFGFVKVSDAVTGRTLLFLQGHTGLVASVAFSPDGTRIVSGGIDNAVKVWDVTTREEAPTLK